MSAYSPARRPKARPRARAPRLVLLEEAGALYLDVNGSHSAVGLSMLIPLAEHEAEGYCESGGGFLSRLAAEVQEHALTAYRARNVAAEFGASVSEAVSRWRASDAPGAG